VPQFLERRSEFGESMTGADVQIVLQAALEQFPGARPRIISDNGSQFIAKDFKEFIRVARLSACSRIVTFRFCPRFTKTRLRP